MEAVKKKKGKKKAVQEEISVENLQEANRPLSQETSKNSFDLERDRSEEFVDDEVDGKKSGKGKVRKEKKGKKKKGKSKTADIDYELEHLQPKLDEQTSDVLSETALKENETLDKTDQESKIIEQQFSDDSVKIEQESHILDATAKKASSLPPNTQSEELVSNQNDDIVPKKKRKEAKSKSREKETGKKRISKKAIPDYELQNLETKDEAKILEIVPETKSEKDDTMLELVEDVEKMDELPDLDAKGKDVDSNGIQETTFVVAEQVENTSKEQPEMMVTEDLSSAVDKEKSEDPDALTDSVENPAEKQNQGKEDEKENDGSKTGDVSANNVTKKVVVTSEMQMNFTVERKEEKIVANKYGTAVGQQNADNGTPDIELSASGKSQTSHLPDISTDASPAVSSSQDDQRESSPPQDVSSTAPPRRNLVPGGDSGQVAGDPSEEFSPPEKRKIKEDSDINMNPVLDHENLVEKATDNDEELPWAMYKDLGKEQRMSEDEDNISYDDEGIGDDFKSGENLPELYEFLGALDNGDTDLESKNIPPSLFDNDQQRNMHQNIDVLKLALAEDEIGGYLEEFEKQVEEEVLMIGNIGLGEVQDEERRIREEHTQFQKAEIRMQKDKRQELLIAMDKAKKHVMSIFKEKYGKIKDKEIALQYRDQRIQGQINKAFRRSESQLLKALRQRRREVEAMYGNLVFADRQYGGNKGKRWKIDWNKTSQPIQIKIKCLRGCRDKLPLGQYVLMVSLYSRLGGHVLKWSNLKGQKWGAATLPLIHDGEFQNTEMKIDQSVFTVCPSKPDIRPGMVLMFELFILSGHVTPTDKVVGWGSFPVCDGSFNVVEGKYKTPLLRGDIDASVDKFQAIEERIAYDLENWLCNLYFEIVKLPRYFSELKEYEIELQFSSGLVSYPVRTNTGEEFVDGEHPMYGSNSDMSSIAASRASLQPSRAESFLNVGDEANHPKRVASNIKLTVDPPNRKSSRPASAVSSTIKLQKASEISSELRQRRSSRVSVNLQPTEDASHLKLSRTSSRRSIDDRSMGLSDDSDTGSGTDYNDDDVCIVKKDNGFKHVKGQPGMYYKVHQNNPVDVYARKLYSSLPKSAYPAARKKKKKISHLDELKQHSYNVKSIWTNKGHMPRRGREKMQYIGRMMLAELGLSQWRNSQFWITLVMLVITWFIRMYLHYFGQWVLLKSLSIPINRFDFYAHTVNLNYQDTLLQSRHEIGVVMMGPFTVFFFFVLFVPLTYTFQRYFKWFPDIITQFMLTFGIQTFLDPLWILVVDSALGRYKNDGSIQPIGDAFKLYWHFYRNYRNDDVTFYVSVSMTVFLYMIVAFATGALWYMFFVRLHNNGRLMDIYWRLHGSEEEFFLPFDFEISHEELSYVCRKAEQWRGEEGERRKTAVYDYVWEQEELGDEYWDDPNAHGKKTGTKEITTHISIHTIHPDGLIELYRHFLRLPDGAIMEVFGEINMPGIDEGVKQALLKSTGFQGTSNVVRRSRSLSVSSVTSYRKSSLRRMSSNKLDVPV